MNILLVACVIGAAQMQRHTMLGFDGKPMAYGMLFQRNVSNWPPDIIKVASMPGSIAIPVDAHGHFDDNSVVGIHQYTGRIALFLKQSDGNAGFAAVYARESIWRPMPPAQLRVRVTDSKGRPVSGAYLIPTRLKITGDPSPTPIIIPPDIGFKLMTATNTQGETMMQGLSVGTSVLINVLSDGFYSPQPFVSLTSRRPPAETIVLQRPARVEGTVVNAKGYGLRDMNVEVIQDGQLAGIVVTTMKHGHFKASGLSPGLYRVRLFPRNTADAWMKRVSKRVILSEGAKEKVVLTFPRQ